MSFLQSRSSPHCFSYSAPKISLCSSYHGASAQRLIQFLHAYDSATSANWERLSVLRNVIIFSDYLDYLEFTQELLRNDFDIFSLLLLRNYLGITQELLGLLINIYITQKYLAHLGFTQELLRNYLGITQELLRLYLGITQELLRHYLGITQELLRNYLGYL